MADEREPLLCRWGLHGRRYVDAAFFARAMRCGRCGEWINDDSGAQVDAERQLWSAGPAGEPFDVGVARVANGILAATAASKGDG